MLAKAGLNEQISDFLLVLHISRQFAGKIFLLKGNAYKIAELKIRIKTAKFKTVVELIIAAKVAEIHRHVVAADTACARQVIGFLQTDFVIRHRNGAVNNRVGIGWNEGDFRPFA